MENRDEKQRRSLDAQLNHDPRPAAAGRELGPSSGVAALMAAMRMEVKT